jgi:hypothetical protein
LQHLRLSLNRGKLHSFVHSRQSGPKEKKMNLAEALLYALRDRGAGEVFGIPGDFVLPFFRVS